eukprot:TRINITY_DN67384_c5_g3_i1.p1 TRINITY_DN67384_c5_g3~~TRINITY_DN67384_c5_g3_i1.p1  ORF type:complete len:111 (-),score=14.94 TRINITY_DN67384_c5_g3_i1:517-849(-)
MAPVTIKFIVAGVPKMNGQQLEFTFDSGRTIAECKQQIISTWPDEHKDADIQKKRIRMVRSGQVLDDKLTLTDLSLDNDPPTLHLMLQGDAGAPGADDAAKRDNKCCIIL